jgi:ABC-type branched-subunit amino acid transport system substrate-binding protein
MNLPSSGTLPTKRNLILWIACAMVLAMALGACGSSASDGSASPSTPGGSSPAAGGSGSSGNVASCAGVPAPCSTSKPPATGSAVRVGVATIENDPIGDFTSAALGAQAATNYLNAHGGITGHEVKLDICPMKSTSGGGVCANSFVAHRDVAVILGISTQDDVMFPILKSAGIPVLGGSPLTPADSVFDGNHWEFSGGPLSQLSAMPSYAVSHLHIKSAVIVQPAAANGPTLTGYVQASLTKNGVTNVKVVQGPAATADPTSTLVQANASHPDAIFFEYNPPACATVMTDVKQLGITAKTFHFSSCNDTRVIEAAGAASDGVYTSADQLLTTFAPDNPQVKFYVAAMDAAGYASKVSDVLGALGFQAAMNFYAAANQIGAAKLDGKSIDSYFAGSRNKPNWLSDTYSCAVPPLPAASTSLCASSERIVQIQNGKLVDVGGKWYSS